MIKIVTLPIFLSILLLLSIGILVIYSSSASLALQQLIFAFVGSIFYFLISQTYTDAFINLSKPLYFVIIALLILVLIVGIETRGSIRWIPLGIFNIQPSEFAKPVIIIFLASFWAKNIPTWLNIIKSNFFLIPVLLLIFKQPDLGTTLTVCAIWLGILFNSRVSMRKIVVVLLVICFSVPVFWFTLQDYQRQRITSFLAPESDPLGVGYNLIQSTIAVGSGQLFGRGLGYGTQSRLQFLPEYRTDFIFASIAEEFGFFGSVLILLVYIFLMSFCFKIASEANYFGSLIASGVGVMLLFQTFVNIGMNIGVLPITGITLPLISYGGSSLISTLISLGLVASVAKSNKK